MATTFPQWVRQNAVPQDGAILEGSQTQHQMVRFWKEHRPHMYRYLDRNGLAMKLAMILENKAFNQYWPQRLSMPITDAQEQAERDWYMMEPETPEETPEQYLPELMNR